MADHTNCRVHTRREARWEARAARGTGLSAEADWSSDTREWTRIYRLSPYLLSYLCLGHLTKKE